MARDSSRSMPGPVVALAGWLLPGAGYWVLGQRARAMTVGLTIILLFLLGIFVAGIRVVDAPDLAGNGLTRENVMRRVLDKPWFIGQVLTGPIGIASAWVSSRTAASSSTAQIKSHGRVAEIGTLYTAVAGMLNLMALIDAASRTAPAEPETQE